LCFAKAVPRGWLGVTLANLRALVRGGDLLLKTRAHSCYYSRMRYEYIIIGGGIAGITAAETIREHDPKGEIAIFSREPHLLYSRVEIPSFLKGLVRRDQLFLRTLGDFDKKRINLFSERSVESINIRHKKVVLDNRESVFYGKLLIAAGGELEQWKVPGAYLNGVVRMQTLDDADAIAKHLGEAKKAVVVGDSFTALEFLEIFSLKKIPVTLVCLAPSVFPAILDAAGMELFTHNFKKHKIETRFGESIREVKGTECVTGVRTSRPAELEADTVAVDLGSTKNLVFFTGQDIEIGKNGVKTNEYLKTSGEDVWAAGDITEYYDVVFEHHRSVSNWTSAFLQGETAGLNMVGKKTPFKNVSFYSITNLGLHITALGECETGPDIETVSRSDTLQGMYERFFLDRSGILKGVFISNMFQDKPILATWIERKVSLAGIRGRLSDIGLDLKDVVIG